MPCLFGPSLHNTLAPLWVTKYCKCLPVVKASHNSTCSPKAYITGTASTTVSVSTVSIHDHDVLDGKRAAT